MKFLKFKNPLTEITQTLSATNDLKRFLKNFFQIFKLFRTEKMGLQNFYIESILFVE